MVLAPAGLNAALTGHSLMSTDARAARILQEWSKFYPVLKDERSNGSIPCLVEIIHSDNKMLYPSSLVGVPVARTGICPYLCCLKGRPHHVVIYVGEWPSGLYSLRQVTEVTPGRVRSNSGLGTSEA